MGSPVSVTPSDYERKDHVTELSYLAARPSWYSEPFMCLFYFFFGPTAQPTFTRVRAMGNETFYWDGLTATGALFHSSDIQSHRREIQSNRRDIQDDRKDIQSNRRDIQSTKPD